MGVSLTQVARLKAKLSWPEKLWSGKGQFEGKEGRFVPHNKKKLG